MKISVRLKLSDFINTDLENKVMNLIIKYHNEIPVPVRLKLWHDEGDIEPIVVARFLDKWQNKLEYRTSIRSDSKQGLDDFTWFNIISYEDYSPNYKCQFWIKYHTPYSLIDLINKFGEMALFYTQPPQRPQKRNDNE